MERSSRNRPLPYYPRYVQDWATSPKVRAMRTLAERGLYSELLDLQWQEGSLPADPAAVRAELGLGTTKEFSAAWPRVEPCFPVGADGRRRNERLEAERDKALRIVGARKKAGKQSARNSLLKKIIRTHVEHMQARVEHGASDVQLFRDRDIDTEKERRVESGLGIEPPGDLEHSLKHPLLVADATVGVEKGNGKPARKRRKAPEEEPGFAEFYEQVYPRPTHRQDAARAYATLSEEERAGLAGGVERWKQSREWRSGAIHHPATFINKRLFAENTPKDVVTEDEGDWQENFKARHKGGKT